MTHVIGSLGVAQPQRATSGEASDTAGTGVQAPAALQATGQDQPAPVAAKANTSRPSEAISLVTTASIMRLPCHPGAGRDPHGLTPTHLSRQHPPPTIGAGVVWGHQSVARSASCITRRGVSTVESTSGNGWKERS